MRFWIVMAALFVIGLLWLNSPQADDVRTRNQDIELRPGSPAEASRNIIQGATDASDLMADTLFMAAIASGVVFVISRLSGTKAAPKGEMSDNAARFIATIIACIFLALVLG